MMFALSSRPAVASRCHLQSPQQQSRRAQGRLQISCAQSADRRQQAGLLATSIAAAALLTVGGADAKVVFEKSATKKLFQRDPVAEAQAEAERQAKKAQSASEGFKLPSVQLPSLPGAPKFSLPGAPKVDLPSAPSINTSGDIDPRKIALPASIIGILGAGFALSKIDPEFSNFVSNASLKDSTGYVGYEEAVRTNFGAAAQKAARTGTQVAKKPGKAAKQTQQKAKKQANKAGGGLRGLFGKK